ncbi:MAG TPA: cellulase family glycosylhydrolase [Candidatus Limnocylindrales bacterium]|nr:cellulase family glycosylhydrolase [Candidatus Limnocylindrales bacterium]
MPSHLNPALDALLEAVKPVAVRFPFKILCQVAAAVLGWSWMVQAAVLGSPSVQTAKERIEFVGISKDGHHFVFSKSRAEFKPWGFNYDHDRSGRLLEDYWKEEWDSVVSDFQEMKALGANTARIHLQTGKFINSAREPNRESFKQLARLVELAEKTGLYLDVTGLGCYKKEDVPQWFNELGESQRWEVQARFWEAVAQTCSNSPAIFCYDLMNEPVVTEDKQGRDWTPGAFGDRYYLQRLTLDFAGRTAKQIAKAWVDQMAAAVREFDRQHLITVGAIPWAMTFPGAKPLFYSKEVSQNLDFVSVHFYPKSGEVDRALKALRVYDIGKPMVVEEIFPLSCSVADLDQFMSRSKALVSGWIGFYWGKTIEEYKREKGSIADGMALGWLEFFVRKTAEMKGETTNRLQDPSKPER